MDRDDQRVFRFSSAYFLRLVGIGLVLWVAMNLLVGNPAFQGQYYVLVFALIYIYFQRSYKLDMRPQSLVIWRLGTSTKVDITKVFQYRQHKGALILHLDDGAQYSIPFARFSTEAREYLLQILPEHTEDKSSVGNDAESQEILEAFPTSEAPLPLETVSQPEAETVVPPRPAAVAQPQTRRYPPQGGVLPTLSVNKARSEIALMRATGYSKKAIFDTLRGRGIRDAKLALIIAASPDKILYALHGTKNSVLIWIVSIQAALAAWTTYMNLPKEGINIFVVIPAVIGLLFVWGFYTHRLFAYTLFLMLSMPIFTRIVMEAMVMGDLASGIAVGISMATLAYVWYVRSQLFPDIRMIGVRKDRQGNYLFVD